MKRTITLYIIFSVFLFLQPVHAQVSVVDAYPNLSFSSPIDYQYASESDNRVYVAERAGRIVVFENNSSASTSQEFFDISSRVSTAGEGGLLGFSFHPDFETNGFFYVYYTPSNPFRTVISRFEVSGTEPATGDPDSELILLEISQPFDNHNAGQIRFGPDGYLYIALGDGGSSGDPEENGEDRTTLLGSILRIDVDNTDPGLNYAIPPDNPYINNTQGFREEIYAYGFRNPYRFSFDSQTGDLWVGDVGQAAREEIDVVQKGLNYGWNTMEGSLCFDPSQNCDTTNRELPVFEYGRTEGRSITGGFVYRGTAVPELQGRYVYADFGSGRIWSIAYDGSMAFDNQLIDTFSGNSIITFGEDQNGEIYFGSFDGNIYTFESETATSADEDREIPEQVSLLQNYPNPFNPSTTISYALQTPAFVDLRVFDMTGKEIASLVQETQTAGIHNVTFDASALSSGTYIYRLKTGESTFSKKMILVK